jgi:hypothetical protein
MRVRAPFVALLAIVGVVVAASTATATAPRNLVLQKSDMPVGAKRIATSGAQGSIKIPRTVSGKVYAVAYRFRNGSRAEVVGSVAATVNSVSGAHAAFLKIKRNTLGAGKSAKAIRLPSFGSEQFSIGVISPGVAAVGVLVRTKAVLWEVFLTTAPGLSKSRAAAETTKYARKQEARVRTA